VTSVHAFAPGTVANLGPGLDILGLALVREEMGKRLALPTQVI